MAANHPRGVLASVRAAAEGPRLINLTEPAPRIAAASLGACPAVPWLLTGPLSFFVPRPAHGKCQQRKRASHVLETPDMKRRDAWPYSEEDDPEAWSEPASVGNRVPSNALDVVEGIDAVEGIVGRRSGRRANVASRHTSVAFRRSHRRDEPVAPATSVAPNAGASDRSETEVRNR